MNLIKIMNSIVIILGVYSSIFAQEKMRIAILDLKPEDISIKTSKVVSNMLRTELINIGSFTVIERSQMDKLLKEQGFQQTGCTDQECAVQLGRLMSAKKILIGEIGTLGNEIIISVRIVDVEKGIAEYAAMEKSHSVNQLDQAVIALTEKLSNRILNIQVTATTPKEKAQNTERAADSRKDDKQQKLNITEGWASPDIFRIKATGAPNNGLQDAAQRRSTALENAVKAARNKIFEKFITEKVINSPWMEISVWDKARISISKELRDAAGSIIKSVYDDIDNCEIIYQIEKKNLRKEVESSVLKSNIQSEATAPKEKAQNTERAADTRKDDKQQKLNITEGWASPDIFRVKATGAPNDGLQDAAQRRSTALENAVKAARNKIFEKLMTEKVLNSYPDTAAWDKARISISKELRDVSGSIIKSVYDDIDNCKIIYQVEKKNLRKEVESDFYKDN